MITNTASAVTYTEHDLDVDRQARSYLMGWLLGDLPAEEIEEHIRRIENLVDVIESDLNEVEARAVVLLRGTLADRSQRESGNRFGPVPMSSTTEDVQSSPDHVDG